MTKELILKVKSMAVVVNNDNVEQLHVEVENGNALTEFDYLIPIEWSDKLILNSYLKFIFSNAEKYFDDKTRKVTYLSTDKFGKVHIGLTSSNSHPCEIHTYNEDLIDMSRINHKLDIKVELFNLK